MTEDRLLVILFNVVFWGVLGGVGAYALKRRRERPSQFTEQERLEINRMLAEEDSKPQRRRSIEDVTPEEWERLTGSRGSVYFGAPVRRPKTNDLPKTPDWISARAAQAAVRISIIALVISVLAMLVAFAKFLNDIRWTIPFGGVD
jgi:hypothetical protein